MYHRRFLASTIAWDAQTIGAYFLLLCYQWDNGHIPKEPKDQRRIARCSYHILEKVTTKFAIVDDGLMKNEKLETVREKQHKKYLQGLKRADNMNNKRVQKPTSHVTSHVTSNVTDRDKEKDKENEKSFKINNKSFFLNLKNDAEGKTNFVAPPAALVAPDGNLVAPKTDDVATNTPDASTPNYTPDDADDPYQTDNDAQLKTEQLLADLQNSLAIPENIALQLGCNLYQATQMRNMFINHLRATGYPSANFSHLRAYCTNWCRSHAKTLLNTISQTPQTPRHS